MFSFDILLDGILSMEVRKYRFMIDKRMCIVHIVFMDLFIYYSYVRHRMTSVANTCNITQTCLCNILQYFTAVKTIIFR